MYGSRYCRHCLITTSTAIAAPRHILLRTALVLAYCAGTSAACPPLQRQLDIMETWLEWNSLECERKYHAYVELTSNVWAVAKLSHWDLHMIYHDCKSLTLPDTGLTLVCSRVISQDPGAR